MLAGRAVEDASGPVDVPLDDVATQSAARRRSAFQVDLVADLGITTITAAFRPRVTDVTVLPGLDGEQPDVRLTLDPRET